LRFWDSSAVVPLLIEEPTSRAARQALRAHPAVVIWVATPLEASSALHRRAREGILDADEVAGGLARLDRFLPRWTVIEDPTMVLAEARRLVAAHPLRAADAAQLAAALVAFDQRPRRRGFVTLDDNLAEAAEREGFDVLVPRG
jgi:predicted nucleic acid-binding protein